MLLSDPQPAELGRVITAKLHKRRGTKVLHLVVEASGHDAAIDAFVKDLKRHGLTLWLDPEPSPPEALSETLVLHDPVKVFEMTGMEEGDVLAAPCRWCGYNGEGYWQSGTHGRLCPWRFIGGERQRRSILGEHRLASRTPLTDAVNAFPPRLLTPAEEQTLDAGFISGDGSETPAGLLSVDAWKDAGSTNVGFDPAAFQRCADCARPRLCSAHKRCMCKQINKFEEPDENGFCVGCPDNAACLALGCSGPKEGHA